MGRDVPPGTTGDDARVRVTAEALVASLPPAPLPLQPFETSNASHAVLDHIAVVTALGGQSKLGVPVFSTLKTLATLLRPLCVHLQNQMVHGQVSECS